MIRYKDDSVELADMQTILSKLCTQSQDIKSVIFGDREEIEELTTLHELEQRLTALEQTVKCSEERMAGSIIIPKGVSYV